jgi:dolichol-phosphate mannosyltransferase
MSFRNIPGVSVILPTLNEGGHIQELIREIVKQLVETEIQEYELIVVDDDSPDRTWEIASETSGIDLSHLIIIRRLKDHGLTASIKEGINRSQYPVIIWMDCDFSHPPEKIPQMLYMIDQGFDVVVNSRFVIGGGEDRVGKGGPLQLFLSHVLNWSVRFLLTPSFSDYTSGFVSVRSPVLKVIELRGDYGEYFIDFIYRVIKSREFRVCEIPFIGLPRRSGESKTGTTISQYIKRGWKYIWTAIRVRITTI